jgi:hypothetical protein
MRHNSPASVRPRRSLAVALSAVLGAAALIAAPATAASAAPISSATVTASTAGVAPQAAKVHHRVVHGDIVVRKAGTVISGLDLHGRILVRAANVTIKNTIIRGADSGSSNGLIMAVWGYPGLRVIDTEIVASKSNFSVNGVMGYNFELLRVSIHRVIDQVRITGSNVKVTNSHLYGNLHFARDPGQHGGATHDDNVQIQGGSNITLSGNKMSGSHNAAIQITQGISKVSKLTISNNRFDNGGCTINVAQKPRGPISGLVIKHNVFGNTMQFKNCAVISPTTTKLALTGNAFTSGAGIKVIARQQ